MDEEPTNDMPAWETRGKCTTCGKTTDRNLIRINRHGLPKLCDECSEEKR